MASRASRCQPRPGVPFGYPPRMTFLCEGPPIPEGVPTNVPSGLRRSVSAKHHPAAWEPASEEQRRLRALVRHRSHLLQTHLQQLNRLRDTTDALVKASLETLLKAIATE